MGTRERDDQAEQERQEQELAQQQQRTSPRETQVVGENESPKTPIIIDK